MTATKTDEPLVLPLGPADRLVRWLVLRQRLPLIGTVLRQLLKLLGTDIHPASLAPGTGLVLPHGGKVVVHGQVRLGRDVVIYQHVTIGRGDVSTNTPFGGITVEDGVLIGAGAVILGKSEPVVIGAGAVVGANSVVTRSIGAGETWVGNPARRVG